MRGLLGFLAFAAALIAVLVFVAGPVLVRPLVVELVRAALPATAQPVDIAVEVDGFDLLGGRVGEIRVSGSGLRVGSAGVGLLEVTVRRVGILARDFDALEGRLDAVTLTSGVGSAITVPAVALAGPSTNVRATGRLQPGDAEALIAGALRDAGLEPDRVALAAGGVELDVLGQRITVPIAVSDGAVVMPAVLGDATVAIIAPSSDDAWRVVGLTVRPTGVDVVASIDAEALLGG